MKHKILVIDDEPSIRLLLENFLSADYTVITRCDGLTAIEWLETDIPDMIICDIQMPGMDGFKVLEHVRRTGYTRHTPVLMLSAKETSKDRVKCYKLGAQDYLTKPFNPEELEEVVRKNLHPIHFAMNW